MRLAREAIVLVNTCDKKERNPCYPAPLKLILKWQENKCTTFLKLFANRLTEEEQILPKAIDSIFPGILVTNLPSTSVATVREQY